VLAIASPEPAREQMSFGRIRQLDIFGEDLTIFDRTFPATACAQCRWDKRARAVAASRPPC
jgi:hypothetical protein